MVEVIDTLYVCTDCTLFLANGDGPEYLTLEKDGARLYGERIMEIVAGVEREQARAPRGHLVCTSTEETDLEFSWRPCGCCGSKLGGSRHQATLLGERKEDE